MKRITFILTLLITTTCFSQDLYKQFVLPAHGTQLYNIDVRHRKERFDLYVQVESLDNVADEVELIIQDKKVKHFKNTLQTLKEKFIEWDSVAKESNVKKLSKNIKFKSKVYQVLFKYGSYHRGQASLKAKFEVSENGESSVILTSKNSITSSSNRYIDCLGFILIFNSPKEIDYLMSKFKTEDVLDFIRKKNENKELFKQ